MAEEIMAIKVVVEVEVVMGQGTQKVERPIRIDLSSSEYAYLTLVEARKLSDEIREAVDYIQRAEQGK